MSDDTWRPAASRETLALRAGLRGIIRSHFAANSLEIEVPLCQAGPNRDHGVDPAILPQLNRWLVTSPEHPLKRLVAAGYGAVWSLTPCVRLGESGRLHRPEFTMLEWYRPGWSLGQLQRECIELLEQLLGTSLAIEELSWSAAMQKVLPMDPDTMTDQEIQTYCAELSADCTRDECLDYIFGAKVQPLLGQDGVSVVNRWPAAACAQAKVAADESGMSHAARFELFVNGVELANAYDECWDAAEMRRRFDADAVGRGEQQSQHDEAYLQSLAHDPGQVCGVAMGFDRLVLLAAGLDNLGNTMAFPWEIA